MASGHHLRSRMQRKIVARLTDLRAIIEFIAAVANSYRMAELLPLLPLVACLGFLSLFPDWLLQTVDAVTEHVLCIALGGKRARLRGPDGQPTGDSVLYSVVGALDPKFDLPDPRLLCVPSTQQEHQLAFPSPAAAGWGNATFLGLMMKLAYEDWQVVRDVINHEWSAQASAAAAVGIRAPKAFVSPRFIQGCSFHFMQPAGAESNEELSHIHLDSDAVVVAVEDTAKPATPGASAAGAKGDGVAVVLAFRGTEPLELADFQSDFDAVPEAGEWGCLHPGFLLALGLDPNLNSYHDTLTTFTVLKGATKQAHVVAGRACTPYEVLRDLVVDHLILHPSAKLYVTGHSLGGALAVVFMGASMHDPCKRVQAIKPRVGALYTFGQPRVGDYEFLCHLSVSMLEPTPTSSPGPAPAAAPAEGSHHIAHATTASGASKLQMLIDR